VANKDEPKVELDATGELVDALLPHEPEDLPPIDFSTFIVSLRTSAMLHLGSGLGGAGTGHSVDLALARQEIDLLGILEEKTRGNLSGEEERLLSQILFDLRTRYIAVRDRARSG
jgi:hypothetical protein